jgi:hypothetical protein
LEELPDSYCNFFPEEGCIDLPPFSILSNSKYKVSVDDDGWVNIDYPINIITKEIVEKIIQEYLNKNGYNFDYIIVVNDEGEQL